MIVIEPLVVPLAHLREEALEYARKGNSNLLERSLRGIHARLEAQGQGSKYEALESELLDLYRTEGLPAELDRSLRSADHAANDADRKKMDEELERARNVAWQINPRSYLSVVRKGISMKRTFRRALREGYGL